jgi:hypothetical protein
MRKDIEMNAGLPGIGISGIFYLFTALMLPLIEAVRTVQGRSSLARWRFVATQFVFFWGIMGGFWLTGHVMSLVLSSQKIASIPEAHGNLFQIRPLFLSLITLSAVMLALWISNLYLDWKERAKNLPEEAAEDMEAAA